MSQVKSNISQALIVMSGKGGVGKSTVTSQLAISFALKGLRVACVDVDICGPSQAKMLGVENLDIVQTELGWKPVKVRTDLELYVMSMSFLTNNKDTAVIWRGPKKHFMIEKFLTEVAWGHIDVMIVDTPPGTSDEHISLLEVLGKMQIPVRAILVTTPQIISCNDVRREINLCHKGGLEIIGIIENMNGYVCEHCKECTKIFSSKGGESLCKMTNSKYLGAIPIDPNLCNCTEDGRSFIEEFKDSKATQLFEEITNNINLIGR